MAPIATPESSTIAAFDYEASAKILIVEFKKGGRYKYFDVPEAVFEKMKQAPSKGQFLAQNIKNRFRYARV
jgi:hypothetical protein